MLDAQQTIPAEDKITLRNLLPEIDKNALIFEILEGLQAPNRQISSRFFYDALGSRLFKEITTLPEYYLTRTERPLIKQVAGNLAPELRDMEIVEFGSGDCSKISLLFRDLPAQQLETLIYRPVDISGFAVRESARQLLEKFPQLRVDGVITDFICHKRYLDGHDHDRLFCFFGSTLGNLTQQQSEFFFKDLGIMMKGHDRLILGTDMVKDRDIVEAAYNDTKGVTEKFNLNILNAVNAIAGTNFEPDTFEHLAFYNDDFDRIEMHVRAKTDQVISSPFLEKEIKIRAGEMIHTENSHKFTVSKVNDLLLLAGLEIENRFTDKNEWFSLFQCVKKDE